MPPSDPSAILVVRMSAIGDIVMATPLIAALRRRYPGAYIAWLVQPQYRELLASNPQLDEVIDWPGEGWRALWRSRRVPELARAVGRFRSQLRDRGFDLVIDAQGLLKSALAARLSGAERRVGLGSREGGRHLMTEQVAAPRGEGPIGSEYRRLARHLGLPENGFRMDLPVPPTDDQRALELVDRHGLQSGYAALCPFTTRPQKHWIEARWVDLARRLYDEQGLQAVLLGGPGDRESARGIAEAADRPAAALAGELSLMQAAAMIRRAELVIGVDTGLTHLGLAYDRPTVALFGSTLPYLETGTSRGLVLYHPLPCSPCRRRPTCGGAFTCMEMIGVPEVLSAAVRVRADTVAA